VVNDIENVIEQAFPAKQWRSFRTLVAVSGGPDSVALLRLMVANAHSETKSNLIVAHINHGTRAQQSDADAEFVEALAKQHQLEFCFSPESTAEEPQATRSEETLRNARYERLVAMAGRLGCRYLVTGHHQDDQIETVLFRNPLKRLKRIPALNRANLSY